MPVAWSTPTPANATLGGSLISWETTITTATPAIASERPRGASAIRARPVSSPASSRTAASASASSTRSSASKTVKPVTSSYQSSMRLTAKRTPPTAPSRGPTEMREPLDMRGTVRPPTRVRAHAVAYRHVSRYRRVCEWEAQPQHHRCRPGPACRAWFRCWGGGCGRGHSWSAAATATATRSRSTRSPRETAVVVSHPDAVRQVFTGDPRLLHAGEANVVLLPLLGRHSVLLLDDARAHRPAQAAAAPVSRRAHRALRRADRGRHRARARAMAGAGADLADLAHAGDHARGDRGGGVRRARHRAPRPDARPAPRDAGDDGRPPLGRRTT